MAHFCSAILFSALKRIKVTNSLQRSKFIVIQWIYELKSAQECSCFSKIKPTTITEKIKRIISVSSNSQYIEQDVSNWKCSMKNQIGKHLKRKMFVLSVKYFYEENCKNYERMHKEWKIGKAMEFIWFEWTARKLLRLNSGIPFSWMFFFLVLRSPLRLRKKNEKLKKFFACNAYAMRKIVWLSTRGNCVEWRWGAKTVLFCILWKKIRWDGCQGENWN